MALKEKMSAAMADPRVAALIVATAMAGLSIVSRSLGPDKTDVTGAIALTVLLVIGAFVLAMGRITIFRVALMVSAVFFAFSSFEDTRTLNQEVQAVFRFVVHG